MAKLPPCSGLVPQDQATKGADSYGSRCLHGFNASPACHGISAETVLPECCKEEWCGRLYEQTGGKP